MEFIESGTLGGRGGVDLLAARSKRNLISRGAKCEKRRLRGGGSYHKPKPSRILEEGGLLFHRKRHILSKILIEAG